MYLNVSIITLTIMYQLGRFSGLNYHRFKPNEISAGKLLGCLILKQCHYTKLVYIHRKFCTILQTQKSSPANLSVFTVYTINTVL